MAKLKKFFGEIILLIGSGITSYNLFSFKGETHTGLGSSLKGEIIQGVMYYYSDTNKIFLSIGIILIIFGILIMKNRK